MFTARRILVLVSHDDAVEVAVRPLLLFQFFLALLDVISMGAVLTINFLSERQLATPTSLQS